MLEDLLTGAGSVPNIEKASGDARYVLNHTETDDYRWFRISIPVANISAELPYDPQALVKEGLATGGDEAYRFHRIRKWIKRRGGIDAALEQSPPLVVFSGDTIDLRDGWHRLVIAIQEGKETVPAFIGIRPDLVPSLDGPRQSMR